MARRSTAPAVTGEPVVLTVDLGSSSTRARLYGADAAPRGRLFRCTHGWEVTPDGGMTTDVEALLDEVARAVDGAAAEARLLGATPVAVSIATFWHSVVGVDDGGRPVTPLFGWGDSRAREVVPALWERLDAAATHRRTGCFVHESYWPATLLWLRERCGDSFRRAAAWASPGELLMDRLFGERRVSLSLASATGLLDGERLCWDGEVMKAAGIAPAQLWPLVDVDAPFAGLRPEWARRWPELARVPWLPALGDGACASLGSGAVGPGRISVTVGTSAAVRTLRRLGPAPTPAGFWRYRLDARRAVTGRAFSNGGNGYAWLRRTLALPADDVLERELAEMEADGHGLTVLPGLLGERPPAGGGPLAGVVGLTAATVPAEVARAWLEAIALRIAAAAEALTTAAGGFETLVASGGAVHGSPAWTQMISDAAGRPVVLAASESTCRGAALVALEQLGLAEDIVDAAHAGEPAAAFGPDPARHARLRRAGGRMRRLEAALRDLHSWNDQPETPEP